MASLPIRQIVEKVSSGQIRIPIFQRGFVWEAEMVAFLMDSIYKGYPSKYTIQIYTKAYRTYYKHDRKYTIRY